MSLAGIPLFDMLNIPAQLDHQLELWGKYSEQIGDYTDRGLPAILKSEPGQKLVRMIDPYSYIADIKIPMLSVNGANDRFWATDALGVYWGKLAMPKSVCVVPNAGHNLGDGAMSLDAIGAFARSCVDGWTFPRLEMKPRAIEGGHWIDFVSLNRNASEIEIWTASSDSMDFRDSKWTEVPMPEARLSSQTKAGFRLPSNGKNRAVMGIASYEVAGVTFKVTSPVKLFKKR